MPRKCLVINIDRCTGCDSCIVSCKFENHLPLGTFYNRVMQVGPTGTYPNIERYNLPVQCQQCTHARCVEVCPTGASYRDSESGIVLVNEAKWHRLPVLSLRLSLRCAQLQRGGRRGPQVHAVPASDRRWQGRSGLRAQLPRRRRFYGDLDDPDSAVSRELAKYDDECIHTLGAPEGEEPLTRYILSPSTAHWKELV